jgi:hypothetical protein
MRVLVRLILAPLLLALAAEGFFQAGLWERLAKPQSHAGVSVLHKRALSKPAYRHIDLVTLGSSRPEYGLDHERLAALAQQHGEVYANLSMPGSHWMTIGVLGGWLGRHHPEIRGGIVALSVQDFLFPGNGSYELGIVYPFHRIADLAAMREHVPFDAKDPGTWGLYSALMQYRDDVQDFLADGADRWRSLRWWRKRTPQDLLGRNAEHEGDMCAFGLEDLGACDRIDASDSEQARGLKRQCEELRTGARARTNLDALSAQSPLPDFMQRTRTLVRERLRALPWRTPPVVVLMPMPRVWRESVSPIGLHRWALSVLQPLVDEGRIRLIDATTALDDAAGGECHLFFDFYHQNAAGRSALMALIEARIRSDLYEQPATDANVPAR